MGHSARYIRDSRLAIDGVPCTGPEMDTTIDTTTEPLTHARTGLLTTALAALDTWAEAPGGDTAEALRGALDRLLAAEGLPGATLYIEAPPLPRLAPGDLPTAVPASDLLLERSGRPLGRLQLARGPAPSRDLVRTLALAIDAAASRAAVRTGAARLDALDDAVRGISGLLSVERVLQIIVDQVRQLVGARYAALGTVNDDRVIDRFITSGIGLGARERIGDLPRGHGLLGSIIRENRSIRIEEIARHPDSVGFPPYHPPMRSFLGVPITVKGRSVGNLYLTDKADGAPFTEDDQRLVETFSLHAGIALENARLHEAVSRLAVVDERERIGKDLHDGIIQSLYGVGLSLEDVPELIAEEPAEALARVDRAIDSINVTIRDIRNFIFGLRPTIVDRGDLRAGLASLADEVRVNTTVDVELAIEPGLPTLGEVPGAELLAVAREALSNAARHAHASRVSLGLRREGRDIVLTIEDDGVGFDAPASIALGSGHHGLRNMRGRAEALDGALGIESRMGEGTRLVIRVPLPEGPL